MQRFSAQLLQLSAQYGLNRNPCHLLKRRPCTQQHCTIAIIIQAVRYKTDIARYTLAAMSGLCLMISSAVFVGYNWIAFGSPPYSNVAHFFSSAFPPLLFIIAYDALRTAALRGQISCRTRISAYSNVSYIRASVLILFVVITIIAHNVPVSAVLRIVYKCIPTYGLWLFVPLLGVSIFNGSHQYLRPPCRKTHYAYITSLTILTVGYTVEASLGIFVYIPYGYFTLVELVLFRLLAICALAIVAAFGHGWRPPHQDIVDDDRTLCESAEDKDSVEVPLRCDA